MNKKENQRVALTKRLLKEHLIEILKKKRIQQVSVTELCSAAGINRSTFYTHYAIPSDVLDDIKKDFAGQLASSLDLIRRDHSPRQYLVCICEYIYEHRELEKMILNNSSDDEVLEAALASSFEVWGTSSPFIHIREMDQESRRLIMAFYYHGLFRVIREWIRHDIRKSPEEVADIMYKVLFEK